MIGPLAVMVQVVPQAKKILIGGVQPNNFLTAASKLDKLWPMDLPVTTSKATPRPCPLPAHH
jgi:hypothetical protein